MQHALPPTTKRPFWIPDAINDYPGWYKPIESLFNGAVMARRRTAPNPDSFYYCVSDDTPYIMDGEIQEWYR